MERLSIRRKDADTVNLKMAYDFQEISLKEMLVLSDSFLSLAEYAIDKGFDPIVSNNLFSFSNGFLKASLELKKA